MVLLIVAPLASPSYVGLDRERSAEAALQSTAAAFVAAAVVATRTGPVAFAGIRQLNEQRSSARGWAKASVAGAESSPNVRAAPEARYLRRGVHSIPRSADARHPRGSAVNLRRESGHSPPEQYRSLCRAAGLGCGLEEVAREPHDQDYEYSSFGVLGSAGA